MLSTRLKVSGVDVFSAGRFAGGDGCEDIVFRDAGRGVYKRVVLEKGKIAGSRAVRRCGRRRLVLRPDEGRHGRRRISAKH